MSFQGLVFTHLNVQKLTKNDIASFYSKEYWHKFILENAGLFDKNIVLQTVLDIIEPVDLVPVKYTVCGKDAYFLARNCGGAIEKFCLNLLSPIQLRDGLGKITLSIHICYLPIEDFKMNMQFHLKKAIEKRYDRNKEGYVDLSLFHKEPELYDVLFCPLSRPRFLLYVLSILNRILTVKVINLSNNDIENTKPLELLQKFEGLVSLDLSNNLIKDPNFVDLIAEAVPNLKEINLAGNPICCNFQTDSEYFLWIKSKFPSIRNLDGIDISKGISQKQVWLCSNNAWPIVDEFIRHYFTLYDDDRRALEHTYDKNAIFSVTCDPLPSQEFKNSRLEPYQNQSRTLLKSNNEIKIMGVSHETNAKIAEILWNLPPTQHDPFSFKVDLLYFQERSAVLMVSGLFKEFQEARRIRSFSRCFVLKKVAADEYKITNDLYHVTDATDKEIENSFLEQKPIEDESKSKVFVCKEEEKNLVEVVARLTEMNSAYSERCLEDCNWNVKRALEVFLENYEVYEIPPEAFLD